MGNSNSKYYLKVLLRVLKGVAILFVVTMVGCLIAEKICFIRSDIRYEWYSGIWHGLFVIPNWILSNLFDKNVYCQAPNHTSGYVFYWWLMLVFHTFVAFCAIGPGTSVKK